MFDIEFIIAELERDFRALLVRLPSEQKDQLAIIVRDIERNWLNLLDHQDWLVSSLRQLIETSETAITERNAFSRALLEHGIDTSGCLNARKADSPEVKFSEREFRDTIEKLIDAKAKVSEDIAERRKLAFRITNLKLELEDVFQSTKIILAQSKATSQRIAEVAEEVRWSEPNAVRQAHD